MPQSNIMKRRSKWLTLLVMLTSFSPLHGQSDQTKVEGASGEDIVNAVVDVIRSSCIFSDDRLFLRRLAYVESRDGTAPKTYRDGYDGGIWQVDADMFEQIQPCPTIISSECDLISTKLAIDWSTGITWSDLRKPLYSGLGAALYMLKQLREREIKVPGTVQGQAEIWSTLFRPGANASAYDFATTNAASNTTENKHQGGELDLVFVLDGSRSVGASNFEVALQLVASVVDGLPEVGTGTRVALVVFGDTANVEFYLNKYSDKATLKDAILSTQYTQGSTNMMHALNVTLAEVFSVDKGMRESAKQMTILLTDGKFDDVNASISIARKLQDSGAVLLAMGIGDYVKTGLEAVASEPMCSHVFTVDDLSFVDSALEEIDKSISESSLILKVNQTLQETIPGEITEKTLTFETPTGKNPKLKVQVDCGEVDVYVMYNVTHSVQVLISKHYRASHANPAVVTLTELDPGDPVNVRLVARRVTDTEVTYLNCSGFDYTMSVKSLQMEVIHQDNITLQESIPEEIEKTMDIETPEGVDPELVFGVDCGIMEVDVLYNATQYGGAIISEHYTVQHLHPVHVTLSSLNPGDPVRVKLTAQRLKEVKAAELNCSGFNYTISVTSKLPLMIEAENVTVEASIPEKMIDKTIDVLAPEGIDPKMYVEVECGEMDLYVTYNVTHPGFVLMNDHYRVTYLQSARVFLTSLDPGDPVHLRLTAERIKDAEATQLGCIGYNYTIRLKSKLASVIQQENVTLQESIPENAIDRTVDMQTPTGKQPELIIEVDCGEVDLYLTYNASHPDSDLVNEPTLINETYNVTHGQPVRVPLSLLNPGDPLQVRLAARRLQEAEAAQHNCSGFIYSVRLKSKQPIMTQTENLTLQESIPEDTLDRTVNIQTPTGDDPEVDVAVDCGKMEAYVTYNITDPGYALINDHYSVTHEHPVRVPLNSTEPGDLVKFRLVARRVEDEEAELLNCNGFNYTVSVRTKLGTRVEEKESLSFLEPIPEAILDKTVGVLTPEGLDPEVNIQVDCAEGEVYVTFSDTKPGPVKCDENYTITHIHPVRVSLSSLHPGDLAYVRLITWRLSDADAAILNCSGFNYSITVSSKPAAGVPLEQFCDNTDDEFCPFHASSSCSDTAYTAFLLTTIVYLFFTFLLSA